MVGVCYQPSSSSKRSLSACACTHPLLITTYTVLSPLALANLPTRQGRLTRLMLRVYLLGQLAETLLYLS